jgi:hypothetical protein
LLSMHRDRVIRRIGHAVRRVVADNKPIFAFQQRHEEMRETRIAIVQHADMPRPRHALEDRKLCIAISAVGRPVCRLRLSSVSIRSWYDRKMSRMQCDFLAFAQARLPEFVARRG